MMAATYWIGVFQDGADFYGSKHGDHEPRHIWTAPFKVKDFDMDAAIEARAAFHEWAESQGHTITMEALNA